MSEKRSVVRRTKGPPKTESLQLGDVVQIGDNELLVGYVRFIGTTSFAEGVWIGIHCQKAYGKNDGSVQGVRYFECPPKYGLFARETNLRRLQDGEGKFPREPRQKPTKEEPGETAKKNVKQVVNLPPVSNGTKTSLELGQIVQIADKFAGEVKFIGSTNFADGEWVGIQCDEDGTVRQKDGQRCFGNLSQYWLFAAAPNLPQERAPGAPGAETMDSKIQKELEEAVGSKDLVKLREILPKASTAGMSRPEVIQDAWKLWNAEYCRLKEAEVKLKEQIDTMAKMMKEEEAAKKIQAAQQGIEQPAQDEASGQTEAGAGEAGAEGGSAHRVAKLTEVSWSQVPVPTIYQRGAVRVAETHRRGITLQQLKALSELVQQVLESIKVEDPNPSTDLGIITHDNCNLYHLNELFVLRLTAKEVCSFVELVMDAPQDPVWFVSHWWGTPWRDSLTMLSFHSQVHGLSEASPYWICTFANNQHNLEELNTSDLLDTPFVRAIMSSSCMGTVMLMNEDAEPFRRTWCTLENFISTQHVKKKSRPHLFEVAAVVQEGRQKITVGEEQVRVPRCPALLQQGDADGGFVDKAGFEGAWFPNEVACSGVKVDIATAAASNEDDKRNILRLIIGETDCRKMPQPPEFHEKYDEVNVAIHRVFAPMALHDAAQDGNVQEVERLLSAGLVDLAGKPTRNSAGETPLFAACANGRAEMVQLLLEKRADANLTKSTDGMSPASAAAAGRHEEVLDLLLEGKADPNLASADGGTPLFMAIQAGHYNLVERLLQARADPNGADRSAQTPVQFLTLALLHKGESDHDFEHAYEALEKVLRAGAEPDRVNDSSHAAALLAAAVNDSTDALELLLDARADPNQRDPEYQAPVLSWSAQNANVDAITALINHRADVNAVSGGETALDITKGLLEATEYAKACFEVLKSSGAKECKDLTG